MSATPLAPRREQPTAIPTQRGRIRSLRARQRAHRRVLGLVDLAAVCGAVTAGYLARFQGEFDVFDVPAPVRYELVAPGLAVLWLVALRIGRCYDDKIIGYGADEYRRVVAATLWLAAAVAIGLYLLGLGVSRGFLALSFGAGVLLLPGGRFVVNKRLHRLRGRGRGWSRRVLVVGDVAHVLELLQQLRRSVFTGYQVVGACIPEALRAPQAQHLDGVPVVGSFRTIVDDALAIGADTVAVTAAAELTSLRLRRLGWQLEKTDVELVVAPTLTDVAGPRIHTQPVAGLPLLHVEAPEFRGGRKVVKELVDRLLALVAVVLLSPLMLVIALAVGLGSKGPVLFRQTRVGRGGKEFQLLKFRTMVVGAHAMRAVLADRNEGDGLLFKLKHDPRVTGVGRWLRQWSLDELPQLVNVLLGHMSLVGPRPPLPEEVARYDSDVARRLLVKPGITGLWQVSGRSDLSWQDGLRLDLYYVENWSLTSDLMILWKTLGAVVRQRGAY